MKNSKKRDKLSIFGLPIIAFIFPPIGILLLVKYYLKKNKNKE